MPRKRINEPVVVTDEQILAYDNVPVPIAAQYIGWTPNKLYYALQDHQVPFGFVAERESEKRACGASWTYNICDAAERTAAVGYLCACHGRAGCAHDDR